MLKIIIDNRENKLIDLFLHNGIDIITQNLDIGDIILSNGENPLIIIERKTLSDLCASIKDGRYKEQKIRLINNYQNAKKLYLIENVGDFNLSKDTLLSCKINSILRDNIPILESKSIQNTYQLIMKIHQNVPKYLDILLGNKSQEESYVNCINVNKKANLTKENIGILQLSVIPGISKNIAKIILSHFGSIRDLYKQMESIEQNEIITEISELKNGKRKLGKKLATKIMENIY